MSNTRHKFIADVQCSLGWDYDSAFVVIRKYSAKSQDTYESIDCKADYESESAIEGISYSANFWPNEEAQLAGKPSRPLINMEVSTTDDNKHIFAVDMEHLQSVQASNNTMQPPEKHRHLIELDVKRHFPQK